MLLESATPRKMRENRAFQRIRFQIIILMSIDRWSLTWRCAAMSFIGADEQLPLSKIQSDQAHDPGNPTMSERAGPAPQPLPDEKEQQAGE